MVKLTSSSVAVSMACIAMLTGLIMNFTPGTTFDDDWSVKLPDPSLLLSGINNSAYGTFEFHGGQDGTTKLVGKYFFPLKQQQQQQSEGTRTPPPAIIMAQGLGLMQDCLLNDYINAFKSEGIAVFTFDYATFGHSHGLPRHEVDPTTHISDLNAAIEAVRKQFTLKVDVESISLWGSSLGGGHVLSAGLSPGVTRKDIRAVVAQIPHIVSGGEAVSGTVMSDPVALFPVLGKTTAALIKSILLMIMNKNEESSSWWYVPLHGKRGSAAVMQNPGDDEGYGALCNTGRGSAEEVGIWRNALTGISSPRLLSYRPMNVISQQQNAEDQPPVLLVAAEYDTLCPAKYVVAAAQLIQGSELHVLPGAGHFDVYKGEGLEKTIQLEVAFLRRHLFADKAPQ